MKGAQQEDFSVPLVPLAAQVENTWIFLKCLHEKTQPISKAYSVHRQISQMEFYARIVNGFQPLTIFAKSSIEDVWLGSEYASALSQVTPIRSPFWSELKFFIFQIVMFLFQK